METIKSHDDISGIVSSSITSTLGDYKAEYSEDPANRWVKVTGPEIDGVLTVTDKKSADNISSLLAGFVR